MIEGNTRIVKFGMELFIRVREAKVTGSLTGTDTDAELLQRACNKLLYARGLAAVPLVKEQRLLIATSTPIAEFEIKEEKWELKITDADKPTRQLKLDATEGQHLIPMLLERALISQVSSRTRLWELDSWRIWYEPEPFKVINGIAAYNRYQFSVSYIDNVGIGVTVDEGTGFFSEHDLVYFFDPTQSATERDYRQKLFERLTQRQERQRGTLLYAIGNHEGKCYFSSAPMGMTCKTTPTVRAKGQSYPNVYEYYRATYPDVDVHEDDMAVFVSFVGIDQPQPVAAKFLFVRVMNDNLPDTLRTNDKVKPEQRRSLTQDFWHALEPNPFGKAAPGMMDGFWQPTAEQVHRLQIPDLIFGQNTRLCSPEVSLAAYKDNFRRRWEYLENCGCYSTPPTMDRTIYYAFPEPVDGCVRKQFASSLTADIYKLAKRPMGTSVLIPYKSIADAIHKLKEYQPGVVVFVLNNEPNAYYEVAFQLDKWRVKRVTSPVLCQHYDYYEKGMWDDRQHGYNKRKGQNRWQDFITEISLDVLQLMDAVPFRVETAGAYEAQLVIDVGHEGRYQALSLIILRRDGKTPDCTLVRHVHVKADTHHESINPRLLEEQIVELFDAAIRRIREPLVSLLVIRDGKLWDKEIGGIDNGLRRVKDAGKLSQIARIDMVELRKDSLKYMRLWNIDPDGTVDHPLEGTCVLVNPHTALLAATGAATLHQGTADLITVIGGSRCSNLLDAVESIFITCQLNWSNPRLAQRLLLPLKVTDEELIARAAQEVRRIG